MPPHIRDSLAVIQELYQTALTEPVRDGAVPSSIEMLLGIQHDGWLAVRNGFVPSDPMHAEFQAGSAGRYVAIYRMQKGDIAGVRYDNSKAPFCPS